MRIWDISPAYLNRGSLLGEHRELHGLLSIHVNGKKGYSRHPETMRWQGFLGTLALRHEMLVAEMRLRGYEHHSPLPIEPSWDGYPIYIDNPAQQFALLREKYVGREAGRIPLPESVEQLWQQQRLLVLARDKTLYAEIVENLADFGFEYLAEKLTRVLYHPSQQEMLLNTIDLLHKCSSRPPRRRVYEKPAPGTARGAG